MNYADATCEFCGKPFRCLSGTPLRCRKHRGKKSRPTQGQEKQCGKNDGGDLVPRRLTNTKLD